MDRLQPALSATQLYPENAVFMARTNLFETRMLGYTAQQLDSATSILMGLLNGLATVRHEATFSNEILDLFQRAGIELDEDLHLYQTGQQARDCADKLISAGKKLFWPYPPPAGYYPDSAHLVPLDLYRFLNAKQNLPKLIPVEHLAPRQMMSHDQLAAFEPDLPVCLKAAGDAATGWGFAVFHCPDRTAFVKAREWLAAHRESVPAVLIEQWLDVRCCWCVGVAVSDEGTVCFGGAEQIFHAPTKQAGSQIDPERALPPDAVVLAVKVGEAARALGFRGVAGFDIGLAMDGRLILFDPNFRIASSTQQILFHQSAVERCGLPVSRSFQTTPVGPFKHTSARLHAPIDQGWFVPSRFFNGENHLLSGGKHIVTGFVLGADQHQASLAAKRLQALLHDQADSTA